MASRTPASARAAFLSHTTRRQPLHVLIKLNQNTKHLFSLSTISSGEVQRGRRMQRLMSHPLQGRTCTGRESNGETRARVRQPRQTTHCLAHLCLWPLALLGPVRGRCWCSMVVMGGEWVRATEEICPSCTKCHSFCHAVFKKLPVSYIHIFLLKFLKHICK